MDQLNEQKCFYSQRVLTFNPFKSLLRDPVDEIEGWSMVIRPMVVSASATEIHLLIVDSPLARIDDPVLIAMTLIQEISDLLSSVVNAKESVSLLFL